MTDRDSSPTPFPCLASAGAGLVTVKGPVTFATAGVLLGSSRALFAGQAAVTVDLREVTNVDSAGLALLLEWLRRARAERRAIKYQGIPDKLFAIARLSGVEALLKGDYSAVGSSSGPVTSNSESSR